MAAPPQPPPEPERVDNPPPFRPKLGGHRVAPWHQGGDVHTWEPEFRALVAALDRNRAAGEWGLAFRHLRAAARRNLAFCRAEQYNDFLDVLDDLSNGDHTAEARHLFLDVFREKLATTETDHVGRILDVSLRRKPAADKQRHRDPTLRDELMDPPTAAEVLAALRVLRGMWILSPRSCAESGAVGAVEALLRCLVAGVPPPPRDSPSDLLARALDQWKREGGGGGGGADDTVHVEESSSAGGGGSGGGESHTERPNDKEKKRKGPPVMIAFPEGRGEDGESPRAMSIGWEVDDPIKEFGQPSDDEVRCEALEALLTLLAEDRDCQRDFMRRGGVSAVARYLVPWLAEGGGEGTPSEVVQRCIVFLGVLVKHILPSYDGGGGGTSGAQLGRALADEAEATLEETIGVEATREILIAAEDLDDTDKNPLDDSSSEGGSFGTYGSSKSVEEKQEQQQSVGETGEQGGYRGRTEREVGEELLAGSLEAMRVGGMDMSQVDQMFSQMAQLRGQEPDQQ